DLGDDADSASVNTIFRAAHSIKGGAGTFGFMHVSHFTHSMENLLGKMRDGKLAITQEAVDLLLEAFDVLKQMIESLNEPDYDQAVVDRLIEQMETMAEGKVEANLDAAPDDLENYSAYLDEQLANAEPIDVSAIFDDEESNYEPLAERYDDTPLDSIELQVAIGETGVSSETPSEQTVDVVEHSDIADEPESEPSGSEEPSSTVIDLAEVDLTHVSVGRSGDPKEFGQNLGKALTTAVDTVLVPNKQVSVTTSVAKASTQIEATNTPTADMPATKQKPNEASEQAPKVNAESSIRVKIEKIDQLINLVGELVITQSMLSQLSDHYGEVVPAPLRAGIEQLQRNSREIQEGIMQVRMLPISFIFSRFPRLVRDLSRKMGKLVELEIKGEGTELDKTVLEAIGDPLVHLVRNALDHGVETPDARLANGKSETGCVTLSASHQGGNVVIEISDDGAGINPRKLLKKAIEKGVVAEDESLSDDEILELIFHPGFSTADQVSDVSGRGVGMDVVRRNIRELGGTVEVSSKIGSGTRFRVQLPLTLAIIDGQLVRLGRAVYILPLLSIIETIPSESVEIQDIGGRGSQMFYFRDQFVPLLDMANVFNTASSREQSDTSESLVVVVESFGQKVGLKVDELLSQQQVVIKSLEANLYSVPGLTGATILGDGTVALIVDIPGLIATLQRNERDSYRTKGAA
ncbi:MAG: chemotaxis protein CheA, partial [Gammaproteobacteria bacterium]|nr:chemotaxis protein CheA [Gammaproteobacteria bacterium]